MDAAPIRPRILLADDDETLCELLGEYLRGEGVEVEAVHDGPGALAAVRADPVDLLVLDIMLPGLDGLEVLRRIRAGGGADAGPGWLQRLPVIMLTARGDDVERIVGLELGADDYVPKPCHPRELLARIRSVLRRSRAPAPGAEAPPPLVCDDLVIDRGRREARLAGTPLSLTSTELDLLTMLVARRGYPVTKQALSEQVLGRPLGPFDRAIDVHVSHLRRKLGPAPDGGERIATVRGTGYQYLPSRDEPAGSP